MLSDAQYPAANLAPDECWDLLAGYHRGPAGRECA